MDLSWCNNFVLLVIILFGDYNTADSTVGQSLEEIVREKCLEKRGYTALDDNITFFRVVEAVEGEDVLFPCSYCGEYCEDAARVWYWRSRNVNSTEEEVQLGLKANLTNNRLFTLPDHSLTIHNVSANDTGMYYCRSLYEEETVVFQFSLDLVLSEIPVETETKKRGWKEYVGKTILEINKSIYEKDNVELITLLDKIKIKVSSEWDPWLACDGCINLMKRFAKCRIKPKLNRVIYPDINETNLDDSQQLLYRSVALSCHSLDIRKWFPFLFSLTSQIPNFMQTQPCYGDCLQKNRALHEPKYYLNVKLNEGDTKFFDCPDTDLRSKITWRKDSILLQAVRSKEKSEAKRFFRKWFSKKQSGTTGTFVDRMNILHLTQVTSKDSAVYICYVNDRPIKGFNVTVMYADETQAQRYYHFLLLFVYSTVISSAIVLAGIMWGFCRRDLFLSGSDDDPLLKDENLGNQ